MTPGIVLEWMFVVGMGVALIAGVVGVGILFYMTIKDLR